MPVPRDLEKRVRAKLKQNPAMSWDQAVAELAERSDDELDEKA